MVALSLFGVVIGVAGFLLFPADVRWMFFAIFCGQAWSWCCCETGWPRRTLDRSLSPRGMVGGDDDQTPTSASEDSERGHSESRVAQTRLRLGRGATRGLP